MPDQIDLFSYSMPRYKIDKPIRLIELFAGIGSQYASLKRLGADVTPWKVIEFDRFAVASYNAVHGTNFTPKDITQTHAEDLEITDTSEYLYILTYSFPCIAKGTLVLTKDGFKPIEEVRIGDEVITHKNQYKKVLESRKTGTKETLKIKAMSFDELVCTKNHKFYVREMYHKYPTLENGKRAAWRLFHEPQWLEAEKLTKNHYLGYAINQNEIMPKWDGIDYEWRDGRKTRHKNNVKKLMYKSEFWWLIGRYVGDGWHRKQGGIIICCAKNEIEEIMEQLENLKLNYSVVNERTVYKIHIADKEIEKFVEPFGRGAINKKIPSFMYDMPTYYLISFIDGYVSADGSYNNEKWRITTISRQLAYGIGQLITKTYQVPYKMYKVNRPKKTVIEGRTVNQNDTYEVVWKYQKKQDHAFYEDGYVWFPIRSIEDGEVQDVYDLEVEDDHSFTANGTIVHNCQDLSLAGKGRGMEKGSGTRSGLLWEVERILDECTELPQVLLMENVPQVIGSKNIKNFQSWRSKLESLGYSNYVQLLNAKDYGIPQNRNRCFMVSILGEYYYEFPKKKKLKLRLKDLLEDKVDEKYYLSDEVIQNFVAKNIRDKEKGNGFRFEPCERERE